MYTIEPIAHIRTDFPTKFGLPRQSCVEELEGVIEFEPKYRDPNTVRGLENYSHIWLIWLFSENIGKGFSPTVRPPRLGGNTRRGVFATRSPFRPNSIAMTAVKIVKISPEPKIWVAGIDMTDNTPIIDIKPYMPADRIDTIKALNTEKNIAVNIEKELLNRLPKDKHNALIKLLQEDPRPSYHKEGRRYGFFFAGFEIFFKVENAVLEVLDIIKAE
ncbi:MAG: tRNA (N6-threonylcarbamoyladenosine(37)-N6)-methyltransferase TrmO [Eubacteriales bacterium]|nr:tRNA (N6-threonylcarbamoyladenosine(37)-N6)-methyltransferase TrmO [Eubacteriales bacterium]